MDSALRRLYSKDYADDLSILNGSVNEMNDHFLRVQDARIGLKINIKKT